MSTFVFDVYALHILAMALLA